MVETDRRVGRIYIGEFCTDRLPTTSDSSEKGEWSLSLQLFVLFLLANELLKKNQLLYITNTHIHV